MADPMAERLHFHRTDDMLLVKTCLFIVARCTEETRAMGNEHGCLTQTKRDVMPLV